jgi:hypothetical protein
MSKSAIFARYFDNAYIVIVTHDNQLLSLRCGDPTRSFAVTLVVASSVPKIIGFAPADNRTGGDVLFITADISIYFIIFSSIIASILKI